MNYPQELTQSGGSCIESMQHEPESNSNTMSIGPDGQAKIIYDPYNSPIGSSVAGDFLFVIEKQ